MPNRPPRIVADEEEALPSIEEQIDIFRAYNRAMKGQREDLQARLMQFVREQQPNAENMDQIANVLLNDADRDSRSFSHFIDDAIIVCMEAVALGSQKEKEADD